MMYWYLKDIILFKFWLLSFYRDELHRYILIHFSILVYNYSELLIIKLHI